MYDSMYSFLTSVRVISYNLSYCIVVGQNMVDIMINKTTTIIVAMVVKSITMMLVVYDNHKRAAMKMKIMEMDNNNGI